MTLGKNYKYFHRLKGTCVLLLGRHILETYNLTITISQQGSIQSIKHVKCIKTRLESNARKRLTRFIENNCADLYGSSLKHLIFNSVLGKQGTDRL